MPIDRSDTEMARIARDNGYPVEQCEQLLQSIADALWGEGADTEWSADTTTAIADAIKTERPDLFIART